MSEEVYQAAKAAYRSYGGFLRELAEESGWDKVLETRERVGWKNGETVVQFLKTHAPETRLAEFAVMNSDHHNSSGWIVTAKTTATELEAHIQRCPIFDGFTEAGFTADQINDLCKAIHRGIETRLKQDFPDAQFTSNPKKTGDHECIETYTIPL